MSAYDLAKVVVFSILIILGLVMVIAPKACTKKENRDNPEEVSRVRKAGFFEIGCGVILIVLNFVF